MEHVGEDDDHAEHSDESGSESDESGKEAERRTLSRWFSQGERPLEQCLTWVAGTEEQTGAYFVIFAHEVAIGRDADRRVIRHYEAIDAEAGLRHWCRGSGISLAAPVTAAADYATIDDGKILGLGSPRVQHRHAHEVIRDGPVRLYVDIDVAGDDPFREHAAGACDRLVARLCAEATQRFDGVTCTPVMLDATAAHKFSRHIVIDLCKDAGPVAFATAKDCGNFVAEVEQACALQACLDGNRPLCDHGVYRRNGTLRLFGSTKLDECRPLRLLSPETGQPVPLPANGRVPLQPLLQSLVSRNPALARLQLLQSDGMTNRLQLSRSPSPSLLGKRSRDDILRQLSSSAGGAASSQQATDVATKEACLDSIMTHMSDVTEANIRSIAITDSGWIRVKCASRVCLRKGDAHRSNTIYFLFDPVQGRYRQYCYSPACRHRPHVSWRQLPPAVHDAARAYAVALKPRATATYGTAITATMRSK